MQETSRAYEWLYETLTADPQLSSMVGGRVYRVVAPQRVQFPYVIMQYQAGRDFAIVGANRVWANLSFVVKVVGLTKSYPTLRDVADRVDSLLHAASGVTTDGNVLACVRTRPIDYEETSDGVRYAHVGGEYKLLVKPL